MHMITLLPCRIRGDQSCLTAFWSTTHPECTSGSLPGSFHLDISCCIISFPEAVLDILSECC